MIEVTARAAWPWLMLLAVCTYWQGYRLCLRHRQHTMHNGLSDFHFHLLTNSEFLDNSENAGKQLPKETNISCCPASLRFCITSSAGKMHKEKCRNWGMPASISLQFVRESMQPGSRFPLCTVSSSSVNRRAWSLSSLSVVVCCVVPPTTVLLRVRGRLVSFRVVNTCPNLSVT